jgi:hypothetical protein
LENIGAGMATASISPAMDARRWKTSGPSRDRLQTRGSDPFIVKGLTPLILPPLAGAPPTAMAATMQNPAIKMMQTFATTASSLGGG